ncbi:MAG: ATP-dependent DNA helicase RecG [Candidatus Daviesbacteria bacterium]|nr:ATP-dependent DNA helicase RecG [Candidatus Daviesbacteria bacterium]
MELKTLLSQVTGIGPGLLYKLKRLNLNTIGDLIYHFPFRYDDFSNTTSALEAKVGESVTLQGEIWSIQNIYTRSRKIITKAIFNDGTSPIELTWFNSSWLLKQIQTGDRLQVSGKITRYKNKLSIIAPRWEKIDTEKQLPTSDVGTQSLHTGRLVPIYPETEGISSKWFRTKISQVWPQVLKIVEDSLPDSIRNEMLPLPLALNQIHFPDNWASVEKSRERLGFDELFFVSLATQKARSEWKKKPILEPLKIDPADIKDFTNKLPFKLTSAQQKVLKEILNDLKKNQPMNRLIQGEVGSGKTVVAAIVAYLVHKNGLRTLFMAPTEILAFQHFETLSKLLEPFGVKIGIYTGSKKTIVIPSATRNLRTNKKKSRDSSLIAQNDKVADIIIGTHALLSEKLSTDNVGLVIVDEQQRFGVEQRTLLRNKAKIPHFLTMTATPIPRTIALTLYGDLDMSVIDEMPVGRQKVKTYLVPEKKRMDSYQFIAKRVASGDQVYIITPLIEASETLISVKAAKVEFEKLKKVFPALHLDLLHGRMKGAEKEQVIKDFRSGKTHILVSTSVVEVGMDNPNATIIVIEGAERFGLAQLHQLRGRVGRGKKKSYCFLYTSDVGSSPKNPSNDEARRLKYLETTFDGLKLAELDLKIRGSGEIFGTAQSGRFEFKIASFSNITLLEKTKKAAGDLLAADPALDKHPLLKAKLQDIASEVMPD